MRRLYILAVTLTLFGLAIVAMPLAASSVEPTPDIAAHNEGVYYHSWTPATATVGAGGVVKFSNPYSETNHGLKFTGGSAGVTPSCSGIPAAASTEAGAPQWEGECTFTKPGTYTFVCTVHPAEMKGTITVKNVGEPVATTGAATLVTEHDATLTGTVNPEGKVTEYLFKWGTTESYGQETSTRSAGAGTTGVQVSVALSGLAAGTAYHFQLVAKNPLGVVDGADRLFVTASPPGAPPPPTPTPLPPTPLSPPPPPLSLPTATVSLAVPPSTIVPIVPMPAPASAVGSPLGSPVKLAASQHGSTVHGTLDVSDAGTGGRLEVALFTPGASLARAKHPAKVRVGRLVRLSLTAGVVSFVVPLTANAKSALHRHRRLALTVQIVLTPLHGAAVSTTRSVVLHA
jgi:plastocyanin